MKSDECPLGLCLFIIAMMLVVLVSGCGVPADMPMIKETPGIEGRVTVKRIGVFEDELAYGQKRGVYIIKDTLTGNEFIGISGVGISERGQHDSGDKHHTNDPDER